MSLNASTIFHLHLRLLPPPHQAMSHRIPILRKIHCPEIDKRWLILMPKMNQREIGVIISRIRLILLYLRIPYQCYRHPQGQEVDMQDLAVGNHHQGLLEVCHFQLH